MPNMVAGFPNHRVSGLVQQLFTNGIVRVIANNTDTIESSLSF
jgi:hypothetical protein